MSHLFSTLCIHQADKSQKEKIRLFFTIYQRVFEGLSLDSQKLCNLQKSWHVLFVTAVAGWPRLLCRLIDH